MHICNIIVIYHTFLYIDFCHHAEKYLFLPMEDFGLDSPHGMRSRRGQRTLRLWLGRPTSLDRMLWESTSCWLLLGPLAPGELFSKGTRDLSVWIGDARREFFEG